MPNSKFLLYIDILGFKDLVNNNNDKINELFNCIDNLYINKHSFLKIIVFSDTILVFNPKEPGTKDYSNVTVMDLCEFAQHLLLYMCVDLKIHFRAILTKGEFYYSKLKNIESYYGKALNFAHEKEKEINGIGLFIDKGILNYNIIYPTIRFDDDFHFVYLTQNLSDLNEYFTIENPVIHASLNKMVLLKPEIEMLKLIKDNIENQVDSKIRGKYLMTYHLYKIRYKEIIEYFEFSDFKYIVIGEDDIF